MKIYCILFDTVPRHPKIKALFEKKGLHYADHITCSSTVPTLVTMLSGKTPTEMYGIGGVGHSHTYSRLLEGEQASKWDSEIVLHRLPGGKKGSDKRWNIHIHAIPRTRGDFDGFDFRKNPGGGFKLVPDDLCGRTENMIFYPSDNDNDLDNFMAKMQTIPKTHVSGELRIDSKFDREENHFIFIKYNHYHDQSRSAPAEYDGEKIPMDSESIVDMFCRMIDKIDFDEPDSLFWIFADHGEPHNVGILMPPPDSWLAWCSVTDNITNKKVTKKIIGCDDFKNTVLNRVFSDVPGSLPNDVLDEMDMDRIYVREDGRGNIDPNYGTTVSALKALDENRYVQFVHHSPRAPYREFHNQQWRAIIYDKSKNSVEIIESGYEDLIEELKQHLLNGPWEWFFRETEDENES